MADFRELRDTRKTRIADDPRVKAAMGQLQAVWNMSYHDISWVEVLYGENRALNRRDRRPPLRDYECQWLAIWFPWSWKQVRGVFPVDFDTEGMTPQ